MDVEQTKNVLEYEKDMEYYRNWFDETDEKCKKCLELQLELTTCKAFEVKYKALELEKLSIESNCESLKRKNEELRGKLAEYGDTCMVQGVVDLTGENEEEDKMFQIMLENKVLECEKKTAEREVELLKGTIIKLEAKILQMEKDNLVMKGYDKLSDSMDGLESQSRFDDAQVKRNTKDLDGDLVTPNRVDKQSLRTGKTDKPYMNINERMTDTSPGSNDVRGFRARKRLAYSNQGSLSKKLAPSTPLGIKRPSVCLINVSDSDDEANTAKHFKPEVPGDSISRFQEVAGEKLTFDRNLSKKVFSDQGYKVDDCEELLPFSTTPKRKRVSNIVTSESEEDDDGKVPISKLVKMTLQEAVHEQIDSHLSDRKTAIIHEDDQTVGSVITPRLRLVKLIQNEEEAIEDGGNSAVSLKNSDDENSASESGSDSESEGLSNFIVDGSDVSYMSDNSNDSESNDDTVDSETPSDDNGNYEEIISTLRTKRDSKLKWEFEGDLLSAFGKDPELCMKAVCALYRQQTSDEKSVKEAIHLNGRGFCKFDASRGTSIAEFLTDGDQEGDLKKSVKELKEFDPKGIELCQDLAMRYSKQLFVIYQNQEDPFFLPS